jgi:hypothetical protein
MLSSRNKRSRDNPRAVASALAINVIETQGVTLSYCDRR